MTAPETSAPPRPHEGGAGLPLTITVHGKPAPQGSKQARPIYKGRGEAKVFTGRVAVVEDSKEKHKSWRTAVKDAALAAVDGTGRIEDRPVRLAITFCFDKPASAPKRRRIWPIKRSTFDVDKLQRAVFDALTDAGVYRDDSQVTDVHARKVFTDDEASPLRTPGAVIRVWEVIR